MGGIGLVISTVIQNGTQLKLKAQDQRSRKIGPEKLNDLMNGGGGSVGDFYIKRRISNSKYHILQYVVLNKIHMLKTMYKRCLKDVTIDFFLHLFIFRLKHS